MVLKSCQMPAQRLNVLRTGHRLPVIFVLGILLPGILLAGFAIRTLLQERHLADQEIRQRLELAANGAIRDLNHEFSQWQQAVDDLSQGGAQDPSLWPERVRQALERPLSAVVLFRAEQDLRVFPPDQLLYKPAPLLGSSSPQQPLPPDIAEAEFSELRQRDYPRAMRLYKQLLTRAEPSQRPLLVHRLARTSRQAGSLDEALRYYGELAQASSGRIGNLPADVVGKFELCSLWAEQEAFAELREGALELYRGLVNGRWSLEKSRYLFYADAARVWLARASASSSEVLHLQESEQGKLALTLAVEEFLETPRRLLPTETGAHLAFWHPQPFVALLLSERLMQEQLWPSIFEATIPSELQVSLYASSGRVIFGSRPSSEETVAVTRGLDQIGLPWRLEVRPRQLAVLYQELNRRQNLYLAMSLLVLALLIFGSYLTARTVKRELEIARLKSEFVSAVSHEFRSPLTGIRQLGEMLLRGRRKNEQRRQEYYQMIVRESDRLTRLVENLLDFSVWKKGACNTILSLLSPPSGCKNWSRIFSRK